MVARLAMHEDVGGIDYSGDDFGTPPIAYTPKSGEKEMGESPASKNFLDSMRTSCFDQHNNFYLDFENLENPRILNHHDLRGLVNYELHQ